jgi:hypothetical protein
VLPIEQKEFRLIVNENIRRRFLRFVEQTAGRGTIRINNGSRLGPGRLFDGSGANGGGE